MAAGAEQEEGWRWCVAAALHGLQDLKQRVAAARQSPGALSWSKCGCKQRCDERQTQRSPHGRTCR